MKFARITKRPFISLGLTLFFILCHHEYCFTQIRNFSERGRQLTRVSRTGDAIDAHDGEIAQFDDVYYLYGTSYDCGFEWGNKEAPFCGFKVYSSKNLNIWTDQGYLFDVKTNIWQTRCDGKTYGCFRPHVIFNKKNHNYVLWINVYDNITGYRVFTSQSPVGPFREVAEPKLAVNSDKPAGGLNNGDHDTFVDDDGTGYIAYTDWRTKGTIVIEKLSGDYLNGTGECVKMVTSGSTEAPALFKRNGRYYVTYSDPNCGYCSGTGTSYKTALNPLGPWSAGISISSNSCGGQPSFVSTIKINSDQVYLYGSDLWNNAAKNEALANYYWAPLEFDADGGLKALKCAEVYKKTRVLSAKSPFRSLSNANKILFISKGAVDNAAQFAQPFSGKRNGILKKLEISIFQASRPDDSLEILICMVKRGKITSSNPLYRRKISTAKIGWSAKKLTIFPGLNMKAGYQYAVVLRTSATTGRYGFLACATNSNAKNKLLISKDDGKSFTPFDDEKIVLVINGANKNDQ